ncbi:MAG: sugar phosphate isomerase/epimerase [Spirochaetes bacterium]|nr:sugar phosphate isomerase/epimerase [Spirochaetota bacterium]
MAIITSYLGQTKDRFHFYNQDIDLESKFKLMNQIEGYSGVELIYPYEVPEPEVLRTMLSNHALEISAINVNIKAEPEFRNGGLTTNVKAVREKAVSFIKKAKDYAAAAGADKVTVCPLADGYEFAFQYDYAQSWKYLIETLGEAGDYRKEIPLFVEYKPSETRGHCFLDTAAKTLLLLKDIGNDAMGVTLDFGHSIYGKENPAEALSLLSQSPFKYYVHINDNDGQWDWDYFVGTKHYLEYVEFLYYLNKFGYEGYLTSDTSPTRWDIRKTFEANSRMTSRIWNVVCKVDRTEIDRLIASGDYLETWKLVEGTFFA